LDAIWLKIISLFVIFIVSLIGGIIPIQLAGWFADQSKTISYANCLSGGVLLGASLVHLLVDAEDVAFDYPLAHLCCGVGFFAAFILEKILFSHDHGHDFHDNQDTSNQKDVIELKSLQNEKEDSQNMVIQSQQALEEDEMQEISITEPLQIQEKRLPHAILNHSTGYILFSVLALESFISGSALGFSETSLGVLVLFIAIVTHCWAEAFALCSNFLKSRMQKKKLYGWIILFSTVTPVGIVFGMTLESILQGQLAKIISSILISIAAGTFLYIAIVEIIISEFENGKYKWQKLNLLLIGFAMMSALAQWI